eukprot:4277235-Prymnesium_polylepis.1
MSRKRRRATTMRLSRRTPAGRTSSAGVSPRCTRLAAAFEYESGTRVACVGRAGGRTATSL